MFPGWLTYIRAGAAICGDHLRREGAGSIRRPGRTGASNVLKPIPTMSIAALVLLAASAILSGCNTTAGIGKDMSAAGQAIAKDANDNKTY
jgi:predicted small secreted protein